MKKNAKGVDSSLKMTSKEKLFWGKKIIENFDEKNLHLNFFFQTKKIEKNVMKKF